MKRLVLALLAIVVSAGVASAQSASSDLGSTASGASYKFSMTGEGLRLFPTTNTGNAVSPTPFANPSPEPAPKFYFGNSEDYRFQLGVGYEYVHFRSTPFNSNLNGVHTSLTYYLNDWGAIEGNVVGAFGTKVFGDRSKYLLYTVGPRIAWRDSRRKYEPWMHFLVGGLHMSPQVINGGQNAFAFQGGAGVDLRYNSRISFRVEGDYVRSQLYSQSQNNVQFGGEFVLHF
ncbi:MAG TPA: hypothetical protein VKD70_16280 [Candidatus Acidoferrum sp.]|nr:hypothetical protein [Candidatus Acidoferrum sp.]